MTDVAALNAAVVREEEAVAMALAAEVGPPLRRAFKTTAEWIDDPIYAIKRTVRADLTEAPDDALAAAADRWPHREAFGAAADTPYGE